MEQHSDDGSLAFLGIEPDASNKHFNCPETTQQKLINLSFWVVDFLGYVFYHSYTLLRKSIKQKFFRRVAKLNKKEIPPTQAQYQQSICSWWGWCKHCDSVNLVNNILKKVPYEIKF